MVIIDAQVHIWAPETPEKPYATGEASEPHRPIPLGHEELLREMDGAGVYRCVLVPPTWEADRNDTSLEAARLHPERFAVMGRLKINAPESRALVATWKDQPHMLGIRMVFNRGRSREWLEDGTADWFWEAAERHDIPVMAFAPGAVPKLAAIAERHPGLHLIIDHLGLTTGKDEEAFHNLDSLLALAKRPNIAVKASCLPFYTTDQYPFKKLQPYIRRVYDAFGPRRMFWGSDLSRLPCSYRQSLTYLSEEIPWLSATDKEWITGRGLCEWIGWKVQ